MKGRDRTVAEVLVAVAERAGCELYLTLFTIEESGWAECVGWNDFEIGEVMDWLAELHTWCSPDSHKLDFGPLPFEKERLCPPQVWNRIERQEPDFMEATGNEGASFERFYRGATLVLWPRGRTPEVLAGAPLDFALAYLETRLRDWGAAGRPEAERSALVSLFTAVIERWPELLARHSNQDRPLERMARLLKQLADPEVVAGFLERLAECGYRS
ncbi:MAG TPA: hypothetical protein ENI90_01260, partial [Methylothermaceae bacterium]|nr:hypothetical protein [Methylothermaceae bacterium]